MAAVINARNWIKPTVPQPINATAYNPPRIANFGVVSALQT
jgi:hypothetical protein